MRDMSSIFGVSRASLTCSLISNETSVFTKKLSTIKYVCFVYKNSSTASLVWINLLPYLHMYTLFHAKAILQSAPQSIPYTGGAWQKVKRYCTVTCTLLHIHTRNLTILVFIKFIYHPVKVFLHPPCCVNLHITREFKTIALLINLK